MLRGMGGMCGNGHPKVFGAHLGPCRVTKEGIHLGIEQGSAFLTKPVAELRHLDDLFSVRKRMLTSNQSVKGREIERLTERERERERLESESERERERDWRERERERERVERERERKKKKTERRQKEIERERERERLTERERCRERQNKRQRQI